MNPEHQPAAKADLRELETRPVRWIVGSMVAAVVIAAVVATIILDVTH